jgi:hypothetical protein
MLIHMPQRVDACDGFLAEVATLGEADRLRVAADLLRKVVVVEVDANSGVPARSAGC